MHAIAQLHDTLASGATAAVCNTAEGTTEDAALREYFAACAVDYVTEDDDGNSSSSNSDDDGKGECCGDGVRTRDGRVQSLAAAQGQHAQTVASVRNAHTQHLVDVLAQPWQRRRRRRWRGVTASSTLTLPSRHECTAVRRQLLFDVLSAVRQCASVTCVRASHSTSSNKGDDADEGDDAEATWCLSAGALQHIVLCTREDATTAAATTTIAQHTSSSSSARASALHVACERVLRVANVVASAQRQLSFFAAASPRVQAALQHADASSSLSSCAAVCAVASAALASLHRFAQLLHDVVADVGVWVLRAQETMLRVDGSNSSSSDGNDDLLTLCSLLEQRVQLLRRCLVMAHTSCCFRELHVRVCGNAAADATTSRIAEATALCAAQLLDYLTVRASALQCTAATTLARPAMDVYVTYMVLLVHCLWPYVLLLTATLCDDAACAAHTTAMSPHAGRVTHVWRRLLPRALRASFSHLRTREQRPTDVLTLVLCWASYAQACGAHNGSRRATAATAMAALTATTTSPLLRRVRMWVLRSFASFARPTTSMPQTSTSATSARAVAVRLPLRLHAASLTMGDNSDEDENERDAQAFTASTCVGAAAAAPPPPSSSAAAAAAAAATATAVSLTRRRQWYALAHSTMRCWQLQCLVDDAVDDDTDDDGDGETTVAARVTAMCCDMTLRSLYSNSTSTSARSGDASLCIDVRLPATRWLTVALLVPLARVVQQMQQRRLCRLLRGVSPVTTRTTQPRLTLREAVALLVDVALLRDAERLVQRFVRVLIDTPQWWQRHAPPSTSHKTSRVDGSTRRVAAAAAHRNNDKDTTASPLMSAVFAAAMRGHPHAHAIRLVVSPPPAHAAAARARDGSAPDSVTATATLSMSSSLHALLDTFAAMRLQFALDDEVALLLLPHALSVPPLSLDDDDMGRSAWEDSKTRDGSNAALYNERYWQRRRQRHDSDSEVSKLDVCENDDDDGGGNNSRGGAQDTDMTTTTTTTWHECDVWSAVFAHLCSLHYAQLTLRAECKQQQKQGEGTRWQQHLQRDDKAAQAVDTQHAQRGTAAAVYTRRVCGVTHALTFALDTLLAYTQCEVAAVIYRLEWLLCSSSSSSKSNNKSTTTGPSAAAASLTAHTLCARTCMELSRSYDVLLQRLLLACLVPAASMTRHASGEGALDDACVGRGDGAEEWLYALRDAVYVLLGLVVDPVSLYVFAATRSDTDNNTVSSSSSSALAAAAATSSRATARIAMRIRTAMEAMVATLTALPEGTMLRAQLQPLLVLLTYNRYYGSGHAA